MAKLAMVVSLAAAALGSSWLIAAAADDVPTFDVDVTCIEEVQGDPSAGGVAACKANEQRARETLANQWAQFTQASKATCLQAQADIFRSYVELLNCLQLAKDVKSPPQE